MKTPPEQPLFLTLLELTECWLRMQCGKRRTDMPIRSLTKRFNRLHLLRDVIVRLRCGQCGEPPQAIELVNDPKLGAAGMPENPQAWSLDLTPALPPADNTKRCAPS